MLSFVSTAAVLSLAAAVDVPKCGAGQAACPSEYPCCSTEGTCGNGYVCLGGCDPRYSYEPGSCVAMPVFPKTDYEFTGTEGVSTFSDYLGNATDTPFSYLGNITTGDNNALRIQLYEGTGGSTVSSSHYLWYGKATIKMKTSGSGGVVSDFILLSNVKDEVDYEFVGYDENHAQTNYYWQGNLDYHNMVAAGVSSNTEQNYHEYTIDWQEDQINWIIDGQTVRTLQKSDTKNATTGEYSFPQTPCRVQFGLWPGGDSSAQGTSEWAGGKINWQGDQAASNGYFFVDVESLTIEPYDAPSGANRTGSKSYVYTSKNGLESDVAITDEDFVLLATDGTGDNLGGPYAKKSSSVASSSSASSTSFSSSRPSSSSASATSSSSSASSSSAVKSSSSSASSSSVRSSSSSSSAPSSSSSSKRSSSSSSAASSSSSERSSSKASSTRPSSSGGDANGAAVTTSSDRPLSSSAQASSSSGSSDSSAQSSSAQATLAAASSSTTAAKKTKNGAAGLAVPAAVVAFIPAFFL